MVLGVLALAAAGCSVGTAASGGARATPPTTTAPATTTTTQAPLPVVPVAWSPCNGGLQCGTVAVPVNYADPTAGILHLAVARRPASDPAQRIGSIVINPGGPGASGIDDLPTELRVLTAGLLDRFDIVSFDPRGVGRSAPVSCEQGPTGTDNANPPAQLPDPTPTDAASAKALLDNDTTYAAACVKATGTSLDFVGTTDAAMDLDRIRAALGDAQLTYIGHSYGTLLGETYADLYP
ncbi:MAG TPA: alpha/beta fold hydrolase, partial [Acidimicrobiales bacterium]|nr:alpha/beta fold hydrolase [Acidimicrobiales bacterium]